ncbi:hypothetical protein Tco_0408683 [Tanacetum coccineum]
MCSITKEIGGSLVYNENEIFQDFLNTSESSNDNTNVVNAAQEPFVFNQDPGENSSQSPPHIDHHCCYGCGDLSNGIFCQRCTCESCGNGTHYGCNCPPKVPIISNPEPCYNQNVDEFPQTLPSFHPTCYSGDENSFTYDSKLNFVDDSPNPPPQPPTYSYEFYGNDAHYGHDCPPQAPFIYNLEPQKQHQPEDIQEFLHKLLNDVQIISEELADFINTLNWNRHAFYNNDDEDDDEAYTIVITPVLPTIEPDNSLSMRDEHLSTIPKKEESSVEDLVPIPSESKGISDSMCDVPFYDNSTPLEASKYHYDILLDSNDDYSSSDDDSLYSEDVDYIDVSFSPSTSPNSFLEETNNSYNSLPESETFCFNLEEKSSGNPTSYTDLSLPHYEAFFCDSEPDLGDFTMDVGEDIFDNPTREPRVHLPNVLPTHPTLHLDSDLTLSSDSIGSDLEVSFPSETRNKIFNPGIFIEVESKIARDFEASRARGFCPSITRASHPQLHFGNPIS